MSEEQDTEFSQIHYTSYRVPKESVGALGKTYLEAATNEKSTIRYGVSYRGSLEWIGVTGEDGAGEFFIQRVDKGGEEGIVYEVYFSCGGCDVITSHFEDSYYLCVVLRTAIEREMNEYSGVPVELICLI